MGRKRKIEAPAEQTDMIRVLRGGRRSLKPEYMRDLTTWMVMMADRHDRARRAVEKEAPEKPDPATQKYIAFNIEAATIIDMLARQLADSFGFKEWADAVNEVQKVIDTLGMKSLIDESGLPPA